MLVKDWMAAPVFSVGAEASISEVVNLMREKKVKHIPVAVDGTLKGIISDRDMYRVLVEITGARRGGVRVSLPVEDRPGSIREVADLIREHGFRLQSILSSNDKAAPGQRYVVLRVFGNGDQQALKALLQAQHKGVRFKGS